MSNIELRIKILQEVSELPEQSLIKLENFISDLNKNERIQSNPIMQMSGLWNDINTESLDFLTTLLPERRNNNRRLNHE